ncbi:hypothetical protein F9K97_08230 [Brucella anthropi]|uniref:Uncharacterized protein n=1 Tax=Brucella anthropi TaxID=529 RepID=A0A6I0DH10_BRUAN|nr:hypothetical protein F9L04_12010 [Brucella anthropi]KAB2787139.1 hypothetical protein F9K97_08230 [Brucella anthropi]
MRLNRRIATARQIPQGTQRHGQHRHRANRLPLWVKLTIPDALPASSEEGGCGPRLPFWSRSARAGNR